MSLTQPGPRTRIALAIAAISSLLGASGALDGTPGAAVFQAPEQAHQYVTPDTRVRYKFQVERAVSKSIDLSTVQAGVMRALLSICDADEGTAYPSLSTIASMAKCTRRTAITALQWLVALGWVSVTPRWRLSDRGDGERQRTNLYRLHIPPPALQDLSRTASSRTSPTPPPADVPAHVRRLEEPSAPLVPLAHLAAIPSPDAVVPPVRPDEPVRLAEPSPELHRREEIRSTLASFETLREFSDGLDVASILDDIAQRSGKGLAAVRKALAELDVAIRLDGGAWPRAKKASKLKTFVENVRAEPEKQPPAAAKTAEPKPTEPEAPHIASLPPEQKDQVRKDVQAGTRAMVASMRGIGAPSPPRPKAPS